MESTALTLAKQVLYSSGFSLDVYWPVPHMVLSFTSSLFHRSKRIGMGPQEGVLLPGLPASVGPVIGLFMFAWTARESIHWIVPTIGITIYAMSVFIVFQCVFLYIPLSYARYTSSLFAANDFFRSALACGSVLFAHPLFNNLGLSKGVSVLGGLSVIGVFGMGALMIYGARLRAMSKFAVS
jgi:DHA1 family multidrug resistance protein-like MFS transporter